MPNKTSLLSIFNLVRLQLLSFTHLLATIFVKETLKGLILKRYKRQSSVIFLSKPSSLRTPLTYSIEKGFRFICVPPSYYLLVPRKDSIWEWQFIRQRLSNINHNIVKMSLEVKG